MSDPTFTTVIGLEVHVQLKTETKLFCRCSTEFGAPPNTHTCPVCIGMPGSLPVMNREAFRLALRTAVALNCRIPAFTKWDRKNYYYPDLPKGYQISQFDLPMSEEGYLDIHSPKGEFPDRRVRIIRAHLEEDAGKSMHDEVAGKADSRIDLNRTGTPLLEIVSHPDMRSAAEAKAYLTELKLLLNYLGVSDCNMQEGSLRVDANINLHVDTPDGPVATPIVEVKNMNSFRAVERAMLYEADRQYEQWQETGEKLGDKPKQTRGWDDQAQVTRAQRHKEESSDYRYFPDPDLVPVRVTEQEVAEVRDQLGRLPAELRHLLESQHQLDPYDADVLVNQGLPLVEYFETLVAAGVEPRRASNWLQQDVLRTLNELKLDIASFPIPATEFAQLLLALQQGDLDNSRAKDVFQYMVDRKASLKAAMDSLGIEKVNQDELTQLCQSLLDQNPRIVADVRNGKQQAVGALIGQARKQNPNANPAQVREICLKLIEASE
jgi:aspartyl-tRNA(Asn)/glutamyl-tRNA(Gln) amidotransferase subunit B